ncbi:MAG: D-aminoacyl-tRNA deacylase [Bacteroidales bacterium]
MRIIIQRVIKSSVTIDENLISSIEKGLMILIGIEDTDNNDDIDWITKKIVNLRIFDDSNGVMNLSVKDINGDILLISQFTLHALTAKGNRPSYIKAASPEVAIPIYQKTITSLNLVMGKEIKTGKFGADMKVSLINDGPVTIFIDTKNRQ